MSNHQHELFAMKKYIFFFILFWVSASVTLGQYQKDSWILSPKLSFADYSDQKKWTDYSIQKVPPISVFLEKGINSFLSAGGFMGYKGDKYTHDTIPSNVMQYRTYITGVVASVHYAHWVEQLSGHRIFLGDFDFYISGSMQLAINNTKEHQVWQPEEAVFTNEESSSVDFLIRPIYGIRYYLTDHFCMLAEIGRGNPGMITTGVTWIL
jgi:hypothetical protein